MLFAVIGRIGWDGNLITKMLDVAVANPRPDRLVLAGPSLRRGPAWSPDGCPFRVKRKKFRKMKYNITDLI